MADTTISSSSKKLTSDYDDGPIPYAGPPPKKTTTTSSSSDASHPTLTGPTAYDVKDAAKFMPVTTLKAVPSGPMELSLDAQKAVVEKRLARPIDYPERKADEALREDLARRIFERDARLAPVHKKYDETKDDAGPVFSNPANGENRSTLIGDGGSAVRIGVADSTTAKDAKGTRVDQVTLGVAKYQNQATHADGSTSSTTVSVGTVSAQLGPTNPDGSVGIGGGGGVALVNAEHTWAATDGSSLTVGLGASASTAGSIGVKKTADGGEAACIRFETGPMTFGVCTPTVKGGSGT